MCFFAKNVLIVFLFIILSLVLLSNITTGLLLSLITVVIIFFFRDSSLPYPTFSHPYLFTIKVLSINKSSVISLFLVILKYA